MPCRGILRGPFVVVIWPAPAPRPAAAESRDGALRACARVFESRRAHQTSPLRPRQHAAAPPRGAIHPGEVFRAASEEQRTPVATSMGRTHTTKRRQWWTTGGRRADGCWGVVVCRGRRSDNWRDPRGVRTARCARLHGESFPQRGPVRRARRHGLVGSARGDCTPRARRIAWVHMSVCSSVSPTAVSRRKIRTLRVSCPFPDPLHRPRPVRTAAFWARRGVDDVA